MPDISNLHLSSFAGGGQCIAFYLLSSEKLCKWHLILLSFLNLTFYRLKFQMKA